MNNCIQMEKLFVQAILEDTEELIADSPAVLSFSKKHQKQMDRILKSARHWYWPLVSSSKRRAVVALIAAASLLLVGCTAYIKRNEIVRFVKEVYEKYSTVSIEKLSDEAPLEAIATEYTLTYLPDGYELINNYSNSVKEKRIWQNNTGDRIIFLQTIFDSSLYVLDESRGTFEVFFIGEYQVYSWINTSTEKHICIWTDEIYTFTLEFPVTLSNEEIEAMILSIAVK